MQLNRKVNDVRIDQCFYIQTKGRFAEFLKIEQLPVETDGNKW
jgi:hypothetical protein